MQKPIWSNRVQPTHIHLKTGKAVRVIYVDDPNGRRVRIEATLEPAFVYEEGDGSVWVRPIIELTDGRFTDFKPAR